MKQKKSKKYSYEFGSFVKANSSGIGALGGQAAGMLDTFKNPNKANIGLSTGQGMLSGAAAGASLGPIGMGVGAVIGGVTGLISSSKQKRAIDGARDESYGNLRGEQYDGMNTSSVNPYGTQMYALGGEVDPQLRNTWNGFVDYVDSKGLKGSSKLDQKDTNLSKQLFEEYTKKNNLQLNYDQFIPEVQKGISSYRDKALEQIRSGKAVFKGSENDFMSGLSQIDGWAGSKTTSYKFPAEKINNVKTQAPIGNNTVYPKLANGGQIDQNIINIEKGELQIDPKSGKILRSYNGINPETAGMYQDHKTKGKDVGDNFVSADPGSFIITKSKASKYKSAIDNNDKLSQQTILQNIRNYKSSVDKGKLKFALGADVPPNPYLPNTYLGTSTMQPFPTYGLTGSTKNIMLQPANTASVPNMNVTSFLNKPSGTPYVEKSSALSQGLNNISKFGPAAFNMARGMFGKVDQESLGRRSVNPYLKQIQDNMPQDINMQSIYNDIYSQQRVMNSDARNSSNNSSVYRANRQNIGANTQRQLSGARMQGQMNNNQIMGQRAGIYGNLGAQDMQDQQRLMMFNAQINQTNAQNRGAQQDMLGTGISQLQQVYQNDKYNNSLMSNDKYKLQLLKEMFPNLKNYEQLFK